MARKKVYAVDPDACEHRGELIRDRKHGGLVCQSCGGVMQED